jgi:hypothetical protein
MTESISQLISAYLYGHIRPEEYERLRAWLLEDPEHVEEYVREGYLHRAIRVVLQREQAQLTHAGAEADLTRAADSAEVFRDVIEHDLQLLASDSSRRQMGLSREEIQELAERKLAAFLEEQRQQESIEQRQSGFGWDFIDVWDRLVETSRALMRFCVRATKIAAVTMAIVLTISLSALHVRAHREVATVTDMLDARVEGLTLAPHVTRLTGKSAPIVLTTGVMKIMFDCGVKVVVESPADFQVKSARRVSLHKGKLYAQVSELGHGFRVDTPNSSIIDLGTEFGISVPDDQTASVVHMYAGQATVSPPRASPRGGSEVLTTGQARKVTAAGEVSHIEIEEAAFIRDFNSQTKTDWRGEWLTAVPLPAHDTDRASGIHPNKTYTHLLDFGLDRAAIVNGVAFAPVGVGEAYTGVVFRDDLLELTLTRIGAKSFRPFQNERHSEDADGGMQALLSDAIFLSNQPMPDHYALTLTGLTPGQKYSLRLYYCTDQREPVRSIRLIFNGQGHDKEIVIDQQAGGANYVRYDYTARSGKVDVTLRAMEAERCWHLYGLSNEVIDVEH